MPYGVVVGNHDNKLIGDNTVLDTTKFNQFFGVSRFAGRSYYGGHYGTKNDYSWVTFSAGGLDFVVVNIMKPLKVEDLPPHVPGIAPMPTAPATPSGPTPAANAAQSMSPKALVYYRKAEIALRRGDLKGAVLQIKLAIAADPASGFLRTALAEVELEVRKAT